MRPSSPCTAQLTSCPFIDSLMLVQAGDEEAGDELLAHPLLSPLSLAGNRKWPTMPAVPHCLPTFVASSECRRR